MLEGVGEEYADWSVIRSDDSSKNTMQKAVSEIPERQLRNRMARVLIAEDSPVTQDILKLLLSSRGHEVHIARDGVEALRCLKEGQFDLALMDHHMPGLSGGEVVCQFLRDAPDSPRPVFVAMTADPDALINNSVYGQEFTTIFAKPFDFDHVLDFIDTLALESEASVVKSPAVTLVRDVEARVVTAPTPRPDFSAPVPDAPAGIHDQPVDEDPGVVRVLIAEDSPVTQDILKLLLSSKGYEVDIAHDGKQALKRLKERHYHLALMDYHMPEMNGGEVVSCYLKTVPDGPCPVFVAMTADPDALVESEGQGAAFAKVFAKPFDFDAVLSFIENFVLPESTPEQLALDPGEPSSDHHPISDAGRFGLRPAGQEVEASGKPEAIVGQQAGVPQSGQDVHERQSLSRKTLQWPGDVGPAGFSVEARQYMAAGNDYDAVQISERATAADLNHLWSLGDLHLLPIIDETGHLGAKADISIPSTPRGVVNRLIETTLQEFADARASVHIEVRQSKVLAEKLIASIYARKKKLIPERNGAEKLGVSYNSSMEDPVVLDSVGELMELGLIKRTFFDRMHICRGCRSVRLNAREECFECRSPNLVETNLIHHFKCAYQGPLEDFQQGTDLVCPKCARELRHFGVDYDKPGMIINCKACKNSASDAAIGFQCLDCDQHTDGDTIETRDVYEYALTEKGIAFVEEGHIVIGGAQTQLKFAELPLELIIALNKSAREFSETSRPFCLMTIGYPDRRSLVAEHGSRLVEKSRSQLVENLGNYFGDAAMTHQGVDFDYVLLNRVAAENCRANSEAYVEVAVSGLRLDLRPKMTAFGPQELFG